MTQEKKFQNIVLVYKKGLHNHLFEKIEDIKNFSQIQIFWQ